MSYDIIVSVPEDLDHSYEAWSKALVESNIPFKFSQPFDTQKHEGGMLAEYRGEEVQFEYYCVMRDVQMRAFITFCTDGEEESVAAAKAAALGLSLAVASKGIITDPQTGEKIKGPRALGKLLKELGGELDGDKAAGLIKREYLPCADLSSYIYDMKLKKMGFKYFKKNKRSACLTKEYDHFIHGIIFGQRMWSSTSFSIKAEVFVSFDNMRAEMGIERDSGISMSLIKSIKEFPYPHDKKIGWPHEIFETDTHIIDTYRHYLPELIEWFKAVDTLERLVDYPKDLGYSPWHEFTTGRICELLGQVEEARSWYKKCIHECETDRRWPKLEWQVQVHAIATEKLNALLE